jgi:MoaA/NifB/PqqE/SkfB family radical SAM enzyme
MTKITIYLGSRCNLNCAYCHRKADEKEPVISEALLTYLKSIKELQVRFIGGEPTLYMDEVKRVVTAVPNARFGITTNGILFDRYREYFLRHRFQVCISFCMESGAQDFRGEPCTDGLWNERSRRDSSDEGHQWSGYSGNSKRGRWDIYGL